MSNLSQFRRLIFEPLVSRLAEQPSRLQVVSGPRQVGKTTVVLQALEAVDIPSHYAGADDPTLRDSAWLETQWEEGRRLAAETEEGAILAIDEIQKVESWAETVKRLWDEDRRARLPLRVVLLGSAALLVQRGNRLTAIEVKSGHRRDGLPGMAAFESAHGPVRKLLVGADGTPLDAFLRADFES
jgi:predicted AAA+ superfamily ATPase